MLVVINAYSKYPEVEVVNSTTAWEVMLKLEKNHGYPWFGAGTLDRHWTPNLGARDNGLPKIFGN